MHTNEAEKALAEAERAVRSALAADGFTAAVTVDRSPGPAGTTRVRAVAAGAYPGTGVAIALVQGGVAYGPGAGLADLARALGWLAAPPDAALAAAVANDVLWGGLLALDEQAPPRVAASGGGGLRLEFVRRTFPSGARERLRIDLPPAGPERVATSDADEPGPPPPTPIDRAAALLIALDAGKLGDALAAIRAIDAPKSPRELAALARAAASRNETLSADALMKLGPTDAAAAALKAALAAADPGVRANVKAMAAELWGPDFAGGLG